MRRAVRWAGISLGVALIALAAGCSSGARPFVYKPNPPAGGGPKVPVGIAVLPFDDGTENFTERGTIMGRDTYTNVAKAAEGEILQPLLPEFWGMSFADELAASGSFRSVRFVYAPSDFKVEEFFVGGILKKANLATRFNASNEILIVFRATRISDKKVVWEKELGSKAWKTSPTIRDGCSPWGNECVISVFRDEWNRGMAAVFAKARVDLLKTLASLEGGTGGAPGAGAAGKAAGESVETTIDRILQGK
jgi:hypothetical protein